MISANHDGSEQTPVTESDKIVAAFGRNGGSAASRTAARPIVAKAHNEARWFFCGCRDRAVLVPVDGTYVRRKTQNSAEHHEDWAFRVSKLLTYEALHRTVSCVGQCLVVVEALH
jgi:hypothetical protein